MLFLNKSGESETVDPGDRAELLLGSVSEASGSGKQQKVTLSSIVIFGFFWGFWRWRKWHESGDFEMNMGSWKLSIQGIMQKPLGEQCRKSRGEGGW